MRHNEIQLHKETQKPKMKTQGLVDFGRGAANSKVVEKAFALCEKTMVNPQGLSGKCNIQM